MFSIKQQRNTSRTAFSIVEYAVVFFIVGLLILFVMGDNSLIKSAQLIKAKSLTQSSPVLSAEDLVLWLETTLDE